MNTWMSLLIWLAGRYKKIILVFLDEIHFYFHDRVEVAA